ncbi:microfibril-associated glycoprotein 4-like [Anopheles ziemanni]|uniref:microfibril-associated glycoprotein 4-like n=1 Tax=Anopheles coustani TaxID=139045 RepID=UPI00265AC4B6|nr:microfibril-associated glycoprotein 4-like [Anopheles coustani]XP_058170534.1 microfibril-associated glycoprotein 4-like [Anopheles ziemanni]
MAKLDFLQYKLYEIELGLKERDEEVKEKLTKLEDSIDGIQWEIHRHDRDAGHNLTVLKAHSQQILAQQTACASHEQMRKDIAQLSANTTQFKQSPLWYVQKSSSISRTTGPFKSCKEAPANVSGVYLIQLSDNESPFDAFCEQNSFGGGWLVIQYRYDGSLDFYRNWTEYQKGFGILDREHWLGLERIHQVTSRRQHELLIELKDFKGTYKFAHYTNFLIGNEYGQYALKNLGVHNGTAGDSLTYHEGMKFSTIDRDYDQFSGNCVSLLKGPWWHKECHKSNLNGQYLNEAKSTSMHWDTFKNACQGLAFSRMMVREV